MLTMLLFLKSVRLVQIFLYYLVLDVTANCFCEICCLGLDGFDLNSAHQLSYKEKKILVDSTKIFVNPGLLGVKQEFFSVRHSPLSLL